MEKRRRDRINSSIEQLKMLLSSELQTHQPRNKLEKADILEMAVLHLKDRTRQSALSSPDTRPVKSYTEGFRRCLQETLCFFAAHSELKHSQAVLMKHYSTTPLGGRTGLSHGHLSTSEVMHSPSKSSSNIRQPPWRPW